MKVREVVAFLKTLDQERVVVMSIDEEGNGFNPLAGYELCAYSTEEGEVGIEKLTKKHKDAGYTKEDILPEGVPAVILWPE